MSIERTFLFIHIPKTGGTTIEKFFQSIGLKPYGVPENYWFVRQYMRVPPAHFDIKILDTLFSLDKIYSFAVVRDPLDRSISDFKWARSKSPSAEIFKNMGFEEFISYAWDRYKNDEYFLANHIKPQSLFISEKVTKVFRFEDGLEKAVLSVLSSLGLELKIHLKLPTLNKSAGTAPNVSERAKALVRDMYKSDYENFGYG